MSPNCAVPLCIKLIKHSIRKMSFQSIEYLVTPIFRVFLHYLLFSLQAWQIQKDYYLLFWAKIPRFNIKICFTMRKLQSISAKRFLLKILFTCRKQRMMQRISEYMALHISFWQHLKQLDVKSHFSMLHEVCF